MARANVSEHSRTVDGKTVKVKRHRRAYTPGGDPGERGRTPVQNMRRDRMRAQARKRRKEAMRRGRAAAKQGWKATKRRGRQSRKLAKSGFKHIYRAAVMVGRKKRAAAVCLVAAGVAELTAAVAWQGIGLAVTTAAIVGATLAGGLLIGRKAR